MGLGHLVLSIEYAIYAGLIIFLATGSADCALAGNISAQWGLGALTAGVFLLLVLVSRHRATILNGVRGTLLLSLLVVAAVHLTAHPGYAAYPRTPLHVLYYALTITFGALGNGFLWAATLLFYLVSESGPFIVENAILRHGPLLDRSAMIDQMTTMLPHLGYVFAASGIAFLVSRIRIASLSASVRTAVLPKMRRHETQEPVPPASPTPQETSTFQITDEPKTGTFVIPSSSRDDVQSVDMESSLSSVVYFMSRNFKAYSSLGLIYDKADQSFVLNSYHSRSTALIEGVRIKAGHGVIGNLASDPSSFMSGDMTYYNQDLKYYSKNELIYSLLAVPIISDQNELLGALVVDSKDKLAFRDHHKEILKRFSSLAAALIINVRMRMYQERAAKQFQIFYEAAQHFSSAEHGEQVLEILFNMIASITSYSRIVAVDFPRGSGSGTISRIVGEEAELRTGLTFPINEGLYASVHTKGQAINIDDYYLYQEQYYRFVPDEPRNPGIRSLAIFPLQDDESHCCGAVSIENRAPAHFQGELGQILSTLVGNASIAYQRALLYHKMEKLATTDGLTQLSNHRTFQEYLGKEIARTKRYRRSLSLLLMDIDHFKNFNDTYGHQIGDLVLREISSCIQSAIRSNDFPARYGGEEFTVVLPETDTPGAMAIAERIRAAIEERKIESVSGQLHVTVSLGCATYQQHADTQEKLIECSDKALYYSKENGRNKVSVYRDGM